MRLAGVRTKQIATSLSFVNATLLIARMSNMFQAPLLGGMVDTAIIKNTVPLLENNFRLIILAAFIVACVGYYRFYIWAAEKRKPRMLIHNLVLFLIFVGLYGLLIYNIVGLRVAVKGISV